MQGILQILCNVARFGNKHHITTMKLTTGLIVNSQQRGIVQENGATPQESLSASVNVFLTQLVQLTLIDSVTSL